MSVSLSSPSPRVPSYEAFYGLAQPPFTLAPDPTFLYLSDSHDAAIRRIMQALRRREGFIVLSGPIGSGKTTLCRALLQGLDRHTFSSLVLNPFLGIEDLLRQVLVDFGVVSREGALGERFAATTRTELANTLSDFLGTLGALQSHAVLIIDEAQHLSPRVLEELRVIAGLEGKDGTILQVVLVGQPNLLEVLAAADMVQLDQRISLRALLTPLEPEDVQEYISHRLTVAGEAVSVVFEKAAVRRIHTLSGGIPRVINLLCDRALMAGADAGVHEITPELVERAAEAVTFRKPAPAASRFTPRMRTAVFALVLAGIAVAALAFAPLHRLVDAPPLPPPPAPAVALRPEIPIPEPPPELMEPGAGARRAPASLREIPDDFVAGAPQP